MADEPRQFAAVEELIFAPSAAQRAAKTAFWVRYEELPLADIKDVNPTMAAQLSGCRTVATWWKKPGFEDWFLNKFEWKQRVEYLALLSLEIAEDILNDDRAPAAAKVNLIKVLNELANKMPAKSKEVKLIDESISKMNKEQLNEFISKSKLLIAKE